MRREDVAARYGGEFVVLLPGVDGEGAAPPSPSGCASGCLPGGRAVPITVSAGVAYPDNARDVDEARRSGRRCLYAAKRTGRDRVVQRAQVGPVAVAGAG